MRVDDTAIRTFVTRGSFFAATAGVAALAAVAFFWKLGEGPVRQWDEASQAVNAFEMMLSGELFAKTMDGELDFTNTKPPLVTWLISGAMQVLGPTPLALRLPSAIAAFATVVVTWVFCRYHLKERWAAIAAPLVLLTSVGFTGEHVARGGDYDSLLTLFLAMFAFGAYVYAEEGRRSALWIAAASLALALLAKGVAALLPAPGVLLYFLLRREARARLVQPATFAAGVLAAAPLVLVYLLTEHDQPGYLAAVNANELLGRFGQVVAGGTPRGGWYYVAALFDYRFWPWAYILPLSFFVRHSYARFSLVYCASFLLIISASETKFHWYDAPFYPVAAVGVGLFLARVVSRVTTGRTTDWPAALLLAALFAFPVYKNVGVEIVKERVPFRENDARTAYIARAYTEFFVRAGRQIAPAEPVFVVNGVRYNTPLLFAADVFEAKSGRQLLLDWKTPFAGGQLKARYVVNCFPEWNDHVRMSYDEQVRYAEGDCTLFELMG